MPDNVAPFILVFYFGEAALLTVVVSFVLLLWYRHAVSRNMRAAIGIPEAANPSTEGGTTAAVPLDKVPALTYWEHVLRTRLIIIYGAAGAATAAVLAVFSLISLDDQINGLQAFAVWYVYAWPIVLTLATLLVLSQRRALLALGGAAPNRSSLHSYPTMSHS